MSNLLDFKVFLEHPRSKNGAKPSLITDHHKIRWQGKRFNLPTFTTDYCAHSSLRNLAKEQVKGDKYASMQLKISYDYAKNQKFTFFIKRVVGNKINEITMEAATSWEEGKTSLTGKMVYDSKDLSEYWVENLPTITCKHEKLSYSFEEMFHNAVIQDQVHELGCAYTPKEFETDLKTLLGDHLATATVLN